MPFFKRRKHRMQDLATRPDLTPEEVSQALSHHEARGYVLRNPRLPAHLQFSMASSDLPDARWNLAMNTGLLPRAQLLLAHGEDAFAHEKLAQNKSLSAEAALVLAQRGDLKTLIGLNANSFVELTPAMPLCLHVWVRDRQLDVLVGSEAYRAATRDADPEVVKLFTRDFSMICRLSLEDFTSMLPEFAELDPETLEALVKDFTGSPAELLEVVDALSPSPSA